MEADRQAALWCGVLVLAFVAGCERQSGPEGLKVENERESLCVRYATQRDAGLKAQIAANQDAATMAAIESGDLRPGLPALVAYCVHGAPIERRKAPTPEGEIEHVTFCQQPIGAGDRCEVAGPTLVVAQDRIAANPTPAPAGT